MEPSAEGSPSEPLVPEEERSRAEFRARMVAAIPRWYSPLVHLLTTAGAGAAVASIALSHLRSVRALELATVPIVFVISNFVEWHAHKHLLHRRTPPVHVLYDRHTPEHHRVYRTEDMAIRSFRELRLVLIPAIGVLSIIGVMVPGAWLAGRVFGANCGWLFLLTSSCYVVAYELTHLLYHLPLTNPLARLRLVSWLRRQHATHHDPKLMQAWNFNVTVPLADWILGTWFRPRAHARSAAVRAPQ